MFSSKMERADGRRYAKLRSFSDTPGGPHLCSQRQWWSDDDAPDGSMIGSLEALEARSSQKLSYPQNPMICRNALSFDS